MPSELPRKAPTGITRQFAIVMELPYVIVGCTITGGVFGFLLDRWLHAQPWFMVVLGALGFGAGLRETMRRLNERYSKAKKGPNGDGGSAEP
jgi:F0F1-type ATP synthase assembly protein I